jgi:branched-chain amino acid transport system substrate-binding protein
MRKLMVSVAALCALVAVAVSAAPASPTVTGITPTSITIGATFPLTGPNAAYAPIVPAMKAYFAWINGRRGPDHKRGVYGRQIFFNILDDAYNPANTVTLTKKFVEQDKVFATVGALGTEPQLAVRAYLNQNKVPQALVSTGATELSSQWKDYPWTIGWEPDYIAEGGIFGRHIKKNLNGKKIAILYQNDDYGKDYVYGLKTVLGGPYYRANVVAEEAYEFGAVDVRSQMARIKATGAPVFLIFATPRWAIQSYAFGKALGYAPEQIYVNHVAATAAFLNIAIRSAGAEYVNGSLSINWLKDPSNPKWDKDPAMKEYRALMAKFLPSADPKNQLNFYGFAKAETFVQAMYKAGKNPTRASFMKALLSLNSTNRFALPGVKQKTSATDHFVFSQVEIQRFKDGIWSKVGPLIDGRPKG